MGGISSEELEEELLELEEEEDELLDEEVLEELELDFDEEELLLDDELEELDEDLLLELDEEEELDELEDLLEELLEDDSDELEELLELDELLEEDGSLETLGSELGWLAEALEEDEDEGGVPQAAKSIAMAIAENKDLLPFIVISPKVAKNIPYKNLKSNVELSKEKTKATSGRLDD